MFAYDDKDNIITHIFSQEQYYFREQELSKLMVNGQFEVGGISQTHDDMVRKIEEETAVNEARMDMALGNVDQQKFKIEEEAEKMRANELVKQFKAEMGLISPEPSQAAPQKTIGGREGQKTS